jgi:hypothetical protein
MPAIGAAAACSNVRFSGFGASARSADTHTYSPKAPFFSPKTSSPGSSSVTSSATASTVPAKSTPSRLLFGSRKPIAARAM